MTSDGNATRNAVAATLAWAAHAAGWHFEVYYDAYRSGDHYGGGDPDAVPAGGLSGGTMVGGHHYERLYLLLHRFETVVLADGPIAFGPALAREGVAILEASGCADTYIRAFELLGQTIPESAVLVDAAPGDGLAGLDAYLYPEIIERHALGLEISVVSAEDLRSLGAHGLRNLLDVYVGPVSSHRMTHVLATVSVTIAHGVIDTLAPDDDFASVTARVARRHVSQWSGGWILADPSVVASWLPEAFRERRLAIYGKPQRAVIDLIEDELAKSDAVILGRQYEDGDFFALSSLGLAFQLIDPCRPPFPVLRQATRTWTITGEADSLFASEPDDAQLDRWAVEGRVLVSVIFWTGMIREVENLYRIADLVALTHMRGGVALTVPALEHQPEASIDLLRVPIQRGGVFPHLEPLLASCGVGASIESLMPLDRIDIYMRAAQAALDRMGIPREWRPQGWWTTMDPPMVPVPGPRTPIAVAGQERRPFVRLRYHPSALSAAPTRASEGRDREGINDEASSSSGERMTLRRRAGDWVRSRGLDAVLAPYRPYEFFAPGPFRQEVVDVARAAGLTYMFSKAGFGMPPTVLHQDPDLVALNYTVGQWDGWTPFETINGVEDLREAERRLLKMRRPGWLVGTLDTCLWAFTGPIWKRGSALHAIAQFVAQGGDSRRLVNVTPHVVARYARLLEDRRLSGVAESGAADSGGGAEMLRARAASRQR
jgi:hypothetical protein